MCCGQLQQSDAQNYISVNVFHSQPAPPPPLFHRLQKKNRERNEDCKGREIQTKYGHNGEFVINIRSDPRGLRAAVRICADRLHGADAGSVTEFLPAIGAERRAAGHDRTGDDGADIPVTERLCADDPQGLQLHGRLYHGRHDRPARRDPDRPVREPVCLSDGHLGRRYSADVCLYPLGDEQYHSWR